MSTMAAGRAPGHTADAIVIGGGFFGCEVALELRRLGFERVILVEREAGIMRRASFVNQARVHNGYHYPRAYATAVRSRQNFDAFVSEYGYAVAAGMEAYYAIARGSRVGADQFEAFCQSIGAPCRPATHEVEQMFERGSVDRVFLVRELAFDASKVAAALRGNLAGAQVETRLNAPARVLQHDEGSVEVEIAGVLERARYVVNCTYANLDGVGVAVSTPIKRELTEMALIAPPPQLHGRGFTVMDGPFFSTMPFPAMGLHTLSHVRYTPHEATETHEVQLRPVKSNAVAMLRDAERFLPCLRQAQIVQSIYEIKAVLLRNEDDDARPILAERSDAAPRILSVLGSKIDNIYELRGYLRDQSWN